jgi:uncharacterized protein (TIGR02600 family)
VNTSGASATDTQTQALAANATQLVISQIRDATSEGQASSTGQQFAWASQPGMIRTFKNDGTPDMCYKLYSSNQMDISGSTYQSDMKSGGGVPDDAPPSTWYSGGNAGVYTDLNAPVQDVTGALNYPILDPSNCASFGSPTAQAPYVLGFTVNTANASGSGGGLVPGGGAPSAFQNPVPMPVQWFYIRKSGYVSVATAGTGSTVTVPNDPNFAGGASANPLVGRIAFWTDDETCKVNINTAGEGLFWDTPRATCNIPVPPSNNQGNIGGTIPTAAANEAALNNDTEFYYSYFQPATHELQRYPGHPALVALSPILGPNYLTEISGGAANQANLTRLPTAPRLTSQNGSRLGTVNYYQAVQNAIATPAITGYTTAPRKALYASIDDLFFANTGGTTGATSARISTDPNFKNSRTSGRNEAAIDKAALQASKFFLTANSRAPEVNIFNLPRIACWPIDSDLLSNGSSPYTTGYDRLIAFCSSLRTSGTGTPNPYYFQRSAVKANDGSETNYDWTTIPRNQTIYSYLQYLTSQAIPGFGGNFLTKYPSPVTGLPSDRDQILTEIFDYIRCTNPNDAGLGTGSGTIYYQYLGSHVGFNTATANTTTQQWIKPIYNTTSKTMGFGRSFTLREVGLELICAGDASVTTSNNVNGWNGNSHSNPLLSSITPAADPTTGGPLGTGEKRYQAAILLRVQCVSPGNGYPNADLFVQCSGLSSLSFPNAADGSVSNPITTTTPANPFTNIDSLANVVKISAIGGTHAGYETPGQISEPRTLFNSTNNVAANCGNATPTYYFVSVPFTIRAVGGAAPGTIAFGGGSFTINLYEASGATTIPTNLTTTSSSFIQSITVKFPSTTLPTPVLDLSPAYSTLVTGFGPVDSFPNYATNWSFNRLQGANGDGVYDYDVGTFRNALYNPHDVLVSLSLVHGDARLIAASQIINDGSTGTNGTIFVPRAKDATTGYWGYGNSTTTADRFSCYFPNFYNAQQAGYLFSTANPIVPTGVNTATLAWPTGGPLVSAFTPATSTPFTADIPITNPVTNPPLSASGDWDNTFGNTSPVGSFINKSDDGDSTITASYVPYYNQYSGGNNISAVGSSFNYSANYVTPNRLIPSSGVLGSLPTGVISKQPWRTLLFRPDREHPESPYTSTGAQNAWPPDHLLMDLFWMPQVEPYAISDCFSTAGKINMNYQIVPFTYITRNTALYCLIHGGTNPNTAANGSQSATGEKLFSVPNVNAVYLPTTQAQVSPNTQYYKTIYNSTFTAQSFRSDIFCGTITALAASQTAALGSDPVGEVGGTFSQFKARFNAGDIFRSPSEICDIYLVPQGTTASPTSWPSASNWAAEPAAATTYWKGTATTGSNAGHLATGDNDRERPYTDLYGRLTTKSNTFLVHMRVQSINQIPAELATSPTQWTEGTDVVTGEYRGSSLVERYIDPADPNLKDYAAMVQSGTISGGTGPTLNDLYKFRVVYNKQFSP